MNSLAGEIGAVIDLVGVGKLVPEGPIAPRVIGQAREGVLGLTTWHGHP